MSNFKVYVPPLKIQGIKTKLVPIIVQNVMLDSESVWIEPFMGSGVVGFNIQPKKAIFSDINPHIINFYNGIKSGQFTSRIVREYLEQEGSELEVKDSEHYLAVRERFNASHSPLDFLFLNRSCFNGMMRFSKSGAFNVPYGHKPYRFSKAYVTKIVNQVSHIEYLLLNNEWEFVCQPFVSALKSLVPNSFVYCDPPYIGRHTDYYDTWDENNERLLHSCLESSGAKYMLSSWDYNEYRSNQYLESIWGNCHKINIPHYYHIGAVEEHRKPMMEALLTNYDPTGETNLLHSRYEQMDLNLG